MTYTLIFDAEAYGDIEQAYNYYFDQVSPQVAELFNSDLQEAFSALQVNPFYQVRTKNYRALPLKKFPYLLFFEVFPDQPKVKILALFNTHQDTGKYPE
jgi:plasmid stabilization system protein ParE